MMSYQVQVSNISPSTTEKTLSDFFTFCGKIEKIDLHDGETKTANIYFEKPSAAKTALMLNGGTLDGSHLSVTSDQVHPDEDQSASGSGSHDGHISQEDKPRSGIVAEYLAKGYVLSDQILQRAIEMDKKQGISQRFLIYIKELDATLGKRLARSPESPQTLTGQAKQLDQEKGYSTAATAYYEKAIASPWGQKVYSFYSTTSKQVLDIHEEAKRIATQHRSATPPPESAKHD